MTTPATDAAHATDAPLITFAVTCYNQRHIIGRAIAAALAQDHQPLEILISDDGSTDGSVEVIEAIVAQYDGPHRVVMNCNERNLGIAGHYDRLAAVASGELIICADGDDTSLPHRARRFAEAWRAAAGRPVLIHGPCIMLDGTGQEVAVARPPRAMRRTPDPMAIVTGNLYVIGANYAWTKDFHRHFGPMAGHAILDDHVLPMRAALIGEIAYLDEPLVRKSPGGVANLAVPRTGYDRLFGLTLKELPWRVGDYRQFEVDLGRVERPDRDRLVARARQMRQLFEMQLRMATLTGPRRLAMLPGELWRALRTRSWERARSALLYATAPLSTWALDKWMRREQVNGRGQAPIG